MKKIILLFTLLTSIFSFSQNFDETKFPGYDVENLVGKDVKIIDYNMVTEKYGFRGFYKTEKFDNKNVYECNDKYCTSTKQSALLGKVFKVTGYEKYNNKFKLKIENKEIGTLYYEYEPRYFNDFAFEIIGGIQYSENYYCGKIISTYDKFKNTTSYFSPSDDIMLMKDNDGKYFINLISRSKDLKIGEKGIIILLSNNSKIENPDINIDVKVDEKVQGYYRYSAFVPLTENDIKLLTENTITDYRVYLYDRVKIAGNKYQKYLKCLIQK